MKMNILLVAAQLTMLLLMGCEKNKEDDFPVTFQFELIDSKGNTSVEYDYGETIIFAFKMFNNSAETIYFKPEFITENFFGVFKIEDGVLETIGKPYDEIYLEYKNVQYSILAGESYGLIVPWSAEDVDTVYPPFFYVKSNEWLTKGEYYSKFSCSFEFFTKNKERIYESKNNNFETKFIVR